MSALSQSGRIRITGMRFWGKHGALERERERTQPIDVDLEVATDTAAAAASDRLEDALDYAALFAVCERVTSGESFALLETLAARILDRVCLDARVEEAIVRVSKPRLLDGATPQVELTRAKAPRTAAPK